MKEPFIKVRDLYHVYPGGIEALRGVSLDIHEGETVIILGQNGSGKTTLVKHFNGLLRPTRGSVTVGGLDTRSTSIAKLSSLVGYVFQNPNHQTFLPSVVEEVAYGCRNLKLPEEETRARVKESVELFGLQPCLDKNPYDLNVGIRKEVAMASIVAMRPQVIMLDEPTTGQDHAGVQRIQELIALLSRRGHSLVIITHDMQLVGELGARVVVMAQGEKIADATPAGIFGDEAVLKRAALRPPQITLLAQRMRHLGVTRDVMTVPEMHQTLRQRGSGDRASAVAGGGR